MPATDLSVIIRNLASFGTTILMTCTRKTGLTFSVSDVETRRACTKLTRETSGVTLNIEESMELPFPAKYVSLKPNSFMIFLTIYICIVFNQ